jgi:Flp pilus assembly protein protease CpaA
MDSPPDSLFSAAAAILLLTAALWDAATYRIPNAICASLAGLLLARAMVMGEPPSAMHLTLAVLVFTGAALLFVRGAMGGGDVKLLVVAVLWVPPGQVGVQLTAIAMAGAVLALTLLALRAVARRTLAAGARERLPPVLGDHAPVPYGVAIAAGTLAALTMG